MPPSSCRKRSISKTKLKLEEFVQGNASATVIQLSVGYRGSMVENPNNIQTDLKYWNQIAETLFAADRELTKFTWLKLQNEPVG